MPSGHGSVAHLSVPPSNAFVHLEPDRTDTVAPGACQLIHVKSRATLTLEPGTYYVTRFSNSLAPIESPFVGTVVAPNATVKISSEFDGIAIGGIAQLEPQATVRCDASLVRDPVVLP